VGVDYYYGQIEGLVAEGSQFMVNVNAMNQGAGYVPGNPATLNPAAPFAQNITRNAGGSITAVNSTYLNVAERETTGVDFSISYVWPWQGAGRWASYADWNTTLTWDLTLIKGQPSRNQLGKFGDPGTDASTPGSIPRNRGYFTQTWDRGNWSAAATINYISHMEDEIARTYSVATDASGNLIFPRKFRYVEEWVTFDAQVQYRLPNVWSFIRKSSLRLGCTNLTDEPAPLAVGAFNDSYDQVMHSNRGRFIYTNLVLEF
jgi:iron complex outermembrane recepter protein